MRSRPLPILLLCALGAPAHAAPPADCAGRFVGVWRHQSSNGVSNIATLTADGVAACSGNPNCQQGTWTCSGNVATYNNGMFDTPYTLVSPNLMTAQGGAITVTRIGPAPRAAAAAPEPAFRPDPVTNVAPKSRADALGLGRAYLRAARAAEQYCSYADKMKASESYQVAARYFTQGGDAAAADRAEAAGTRAAGDADGCDRPPVRPQPVARGGARGPAEAPPPSCAAGGDYLNQLTARGEDARFLRLRLAGLGCDVALPPDWRAKPPLRLCLRLKLTLRQEGTGPDDIRAQLARAGCPEGRD